MTVQVIAGDIAKIPSHAIITAINSDGAWYGGIDGVLKRAAGDHFHARASAAMPLEDGMTVVAPGGNVTSLPFRNVVFVIDDLKQPLGNIIFLGVQAAQAAGFKTVTLPTIRMGVMSGVVEKTKQEAVDRMADGIERFVLQGGQLDITFVVYSDKETEALLSAAASQLNTTLSEVQS